MVMMKDCGVVYNYLNSNFSTRIISQNVEKARIFYCDEICYN